MTLPTPNLDDRNFDDIVEEAIRLIPQYCPDWTNYNPSDPGVTLIELFAWMTEMILYRLNKVPDKVYVTLLDLIGIRLRPPQPAQVQLSFGLVDGAGEHLPEARLQGVLLAGPVGVLGRLRGLRGRLRGPLFFDNCFR